MAEYYDCALAFILEGDTEKVFYLEMIKYFCRKNGLEYHGIQIDAKTGEAFYTIGFDEKQILIKLNVVGTVSQIVNAGNWFENRCRMRHNSLPWTAFLCYDTDDYLADVTKFHEGDWDMLRKQIQKGNCQVIDLAAQADIEDIMLLDSASIFSYLSIEPVEIPSGAKGKRKMKKLFRMKDPKVPYHEGERAEPLIQSLNMDVIIQASAIPFGKIEETLLSIKIK